MEMRIAPGTHLRNAHTVVTVSGERRTVGAFLHPNGALTIYPTRNQNEGTILAPHAWIKLEFGRKEKE